MVLFTYHSKLFSNLAEIYRFGGLHQTGMSIEHSSISLFLQGVSLADSVGCRQCAALCGFACTQFFSCVWLKYEETRSAFFLCSLKSHLHLSHAMIHAQSSLLDPPHLALRTRTLSLLFPSHGNEHCHPLHGAQFGRCAEQPPSAGYEPNDLTEKNKSEVAHTLFHGGSACSALTCKSREGHCHHTRGVGEK